MWRGVGKFWIGGSRVEQKKGRRKGSLSCVLVAGLSKRKRGCLFFILAKGGKGGGFECFCSLRERSRVLGYHVGPSQFRRRARKQRELSLGCLICLTCIEKAIKVGSAEGFNAHFLLCLFHLCIP